MTLDWFLFFPALLALFVPLDACLPARLRLRRLDVVDFGDAGVRRRGPWCMAVSWADGPRAFLAALMLVNAWKIDPVCGVAQWVPASLSLLVFACALVAQMHTRRDERYFFAPVIYCAGLWLALVPVQVALVAMAVGGVAMTAFRSLPVFFFMGGVTLAIFGKLLLHEGLWTVDAAILGMIPWVAPLVSNRALALPFKLEVVRESSRPIEAGNEEFEAKA